MLPIGLVALAAPVRSSSEDQLLSGPTNQKVMSQVVCNADPRDLTSPDARYELGATDQALVPKTWGGL